MRGGNDGNNQFNWPKKGFLYIEKWKWYSIYCTLKSESDIPYIVHWKVKVIFCILHIERWKWKYTYCILESESKAWLRGGNDTSSIGLKMVSSTLKSESFLHWKVTVCIFYIEKWKYVLVLPEWEVAMIGTTSSNGQKMASSTLKSELVAAQLGAKWRHALGTTQLPSKCYNTFSRLFLILCTLYLNSELPRARIWWVWYP